MFTVWRQSKAISSTLKEQDKRQWSLTWMPWDISPKMILGFSLLLSWGWGMYVSLIFYTGYDLSGIYSDVVHVDAKRKRESEVGLFCHLLWAHWNSFWQHEIVPTELIDRIARLRYVLIVSWITFFPLYHLKFTFGVFKWFSNYCVGVEALIKFWKICSRISCCTMTLLNVGNL